MAEVVAAGELAEQATVDDPELIARLRAGDSAAFARLVDEWSPVMLHVAMRYVPNRQSAEDVVQDAWLGIVKGLGQFEGRSTLRSWAFSILLNRARTVGVRERRVVPSAVLTGVEPDQPTVDPARFQGPDGKYPGNWTSTGVPRAWDAPDRQAMLREAGRLIDDAMQRLPERQRLVIQMRDVLGMSSDEACAALDLSPENQRVLLHRGRAALRAVLEDYHRS